MTELWQAAVLGLVQGVTEFLPISSSGHLLLIQKAFGWEGFGLAYDVTLHLSTLLAVGIYFRTDFAQMARAQFSSDTALASERRLGRLVVLATGVTAVLAVVFADPIDAAFTDPVWIGWFFLFTSVILAASEVFSGKPRHDVLTLPAYKAALIGLAQAVALFPGISRAGTTMAAGLALGLSREQAARFSFLMSAPIILLAGIKTGMDAYADPQPFIGIGAAVAGAVIAFVTAYLSIGILLSFLRKHSLHVFAAYTAVLGVAIIIWRPV